MNFAYRFRLNPTPNQREQLAWTLDTCRQVRNHFLHRMNRVENPTYTSEQNRLPDLKEWWTELQDVNAKVLQMVVRRLYTDRSNLNKKKEKGYTVGQLKWKGKGNYQSFEYNQSGFELKKTSGQDRLYLNKIGDVPVVAHREIPNNAEVKGVVVKREPTGNWYASLQLETPNDPPEKPDKLTETVGIDVGILNYASDTDGTVVESLDLSDERERLERAQRDLSRKEHGSNNWEEQRKTVARRHADLKRKRRDFLHKLSNYYASEYDLVAVENLDVKGLIELPGNSRNRAGAAWSTFLRMLEYKCKREGTHFVAVDPAGTSKECAACGVETDKPLWVRKHSCPSCGFTADRDRNAAWNILSRGLEQLGAGHSETTPAETALPMGTDSVPVQRVIETGSPDLKKRATPAASE
ncbi:RNA-guided endonuclease TnpB family protein [Halorubrum sp. 2020YC2]|uniref:RNA-guided endonuclease InsQ/TnpB family protein n=1 Tax=Halorubrum sp. 2020YC2 TaxID=2836432 RepID=UPI001BEA4B5E|nr:RNA-guided endonuclease TnpB family protein [Halorubrum sp. 2020YC2]QWC19441.1 transposase [Halorubrum sp. 2020YC2]